MANRLLIDAQAKCRMQRFDPDWTDSAAHAWGWVGSDELKDGKPVEPYDDGAYRLQQCADCPVPPGSIK